MYAEACLKTYSQIFETVFGNVLSIAVDVSQINILYEVLSNGESDKKSKVFLVTIQTYPYCL